MKKTYKAFPLTGEDGVFKIESTQSGIDSIDLDKNGLSKYPYVTRTANNNGIQCFVPKQKKTLEKANTISLGLDTQTVNYQPYPYYTGQNIQILSNPNLDKYTAMYLIPLIKKQLENLNWGGNGATLGRLAIKQIMLPVDEEEQIDWDYMRTYIRELYAKVETIFTNQYHEDITDYRELSEIEFKVFTISDIFGTPESGRSKGLNHLKKGGNIPYVSASNKNNGVSAFVYTDTAEEKAMIQKGNCIAFIRNGVGSVGYSVYKEGDFIATSDVSLGYHPRLNRYSGTFITTMADLSRRKYSFGYKRSPSRLKKEQIKLPVNADGEIDWDFMENYMKRMENKLIDVVCNCD